MARHVRKGDQVIVTSGGSRGAVGEVIRVMPEADRVIIKGVNMVTKRVKPTRTSPQGSIVQKEAPIHISNVSPVVDGRATRVRFEEKADGSKVRVAARGGKVLGQVRGPSKAGAQKSGAGKSGGKKK
jgi:large subunit ribosomal protein L24